MGSFVDYDAKSLVQGFGGFMHIRVRLDVRNPLVRCKKLDLGSKGCSYARFRSYARFQYERLPIFCFLCGQLGHSKRFCLVRIVHGKGELVFE